MRHRHAGRARRALRRCPAARARSSSSSARPPSREEASDDDLDAALGEALDDACRRRAPPPRSPTALGVPRKRAYARALELGPATEPPRRRTARPPRRDARRLVAAAPRLADPRPARAMRRRRGRPRRAARQDPGLRRGQAARHRRRRRPWSLDHYRLRRVAVAAERLAPRYARPGDDIRIDAIFIVPGRLPRHLPNVWHG